MNEVFVDSSAWIALALRDDEHHEVAAALMNTLRDDRRKLVTSSDVFDEAITALRAWGGHALAVRVGRDLRASRHARIVSVTDDLREAAWKRFVRTPEPPVSHTDCTSMAVMDDLHLRQVFTFDSDFRRAGYEVIPAPGK